jgi:hypothetical protein
MDYEHMNTQDDDSQAVFHTPAGPDYGRFEPYRPPTPAEAVKRDGARFLSDVAKSDCQWLWPGRIPLGCVTVLIGDPGVGKSLIALDIAARVTRGAPWPDAPPNPQSESPNPQSPNPHSSFDIRHSSFSPAASVLLLNPEDRLAETIRPRLEAASADCSQVVALPSLLDMVSPFPPTGTLQDCHGDFFRASRLLGALPGCRLLIVDPINAYFSGVDPQRVLLALAEIAERRRVAVVVVSHVRKKGGAAIHRALGSLALVSVARAVWVVAKDPASDERRLLLPIKNNLASNSGGLAYTIVSSPTSGAPVVEWSCEPIHLSPDAVLNARQAARPDEERQFAMQWLTARLADGPCPSKQLKEEATENAITPRTLRRAFRELGGQAIRIGVPPPGYWTWMLPQQGGQLPEQGGQLPEQGGQLPEQGGQLPEQGGQVPGGIEMDILQISDELILAAEPCPHPSP